MKLINKDALVAEIERRKEINKYRDTNDSLFEDEAILFFIDTLEVKDVDFEREIDGELKTRWMGEYLNTEKFYESAKHFFELGMQVSNKVHKGE